MPNYLANLYLPDLLSRVHGHLSAVRNLSGHETIRYKPSTENYPWMEEKVELSPPLGTEQNLSEFITQNLLPLLSLTFPGTLLTRSVVLGFLKQAAVISRGSAMQTHANLEVQEQFRLCHLTEYS